MDNVILEWCKNIVKNCGKQLLIVEVIRGHYKTYVVNGMSLKDREGQFNRADDVLDVTNIILTLGHSTNSITPQQFEEKIKYLPKESFYFGTDNYLWITKVVEQPSI